MATIDMHLSDKDRETIETQITVVPSCNDNESLVMLVKFRGSISDFLSELTANPLRDWQVEMKDTDDISFNRHFHGLHSYIARKQKVRLLLSKSRQS